MMVTNKKRMNVMVILDDKYADYLESMLIGLYENNPEYDIHVHCVYNVMTEKVQKQLLGDAAAAGWNLTFLYGDISIFEGLKANPRFPSYLYYKLIPHKILPEDMERVMFLDIDLAITGSLAEIYEADLSEKPLAAVYDVNSFLRYCEGQKVSYVNSGIVVYNLNKFREELVDVEKYRATLGGRQQRLYEEELLNGLFRNRINHFMPYDYNYNVGFRKFYEEYTQQKGVPVRRIVIHYMGYKNDSPVEKPWSAYYEVEQGMCDWDKELISLYKIWWDYAKKAPNYHRLVRKIKDQKLTQLMKSPIATSDLLRYETLLVPSLHDIAENASLNAFTKAGCYRCVRGAVKKTLADLPEAFSENVGFRLTVKYIAANDTEYHNNACFQILEPNLTCSVVYRRYYSGGKDPKWGPWYRMATDKDLEALVQTNAEQVEKSEQLTEQLAIQVQTNAEQAAKIEQLTVQLDELKQELESQKDEMEAHKRLLARILKKLHE